MLNSALSLLIFLAFISVAWALGLKLLSLLNIRFENNTTEFIFSVGVSLAIYTVSIFILGLSNLLYGWLIITIFLVSGIISYKEIVYVWKRLPKYISLKQVEPLYKFLMFLLLVFYIAVFLFSLAPPTGMDIGNYHYTVPKVLLQKHGLSYRGDLHMEVCGGVHMLYTLTFVLGGEILTNLTSFLISILSIMTIYIIVRNVYSYKEGIISAYIIGISPFMVGYSGYGYLDTAVCLYLLLSIHSALFYIQDKSNNSRLVYLCALFSGLAINTKNTAIYATIPAIALFIVITKEYFARKRKLTTIFLFIFILCSVGGYWFIWNILTTGTPFDNTQKYANTAEIESYKNSSLLILFYIFLKNIFTVGTGWADSGGPIIPFALIIYLLITKKEKTSLLLLGGMLLSILLFGIVIASYNKTNLALLINTRFLLPAILAYSSVICGYSISETFKQGKFAKIVLIIALLFPALPLLALRIAKTAVAIPVVFGIESREEYLGKKIESFNTSNYANKELDKDAYILFAGFRPYYLDHRFYRIYPSAVMNYVNNSDITKFEQFILTNGFTHLIFEPPRPENTNILDSQKFNAFTLQRLKVDRDTSLYKIVRNAK